MRFAEVFLRLGLSLVAWMLTYAYCLWLAVLRVIGCEANGEELYRLMLGMAPFVASASLLLQTSRPLHDVHRILRWLGVPLILLLGFAMRTVIDAFPWATNASDVLCSVGSRAVWHAWWAPLQLAAMTVIAWMVVRVWRAVAEDHRSPAPG